MNRMYNDDFKKEPLTEENESIDYILPVSKNKKKHKKSRPKFVPSTDIGNTQDDNTEYVFAQPRNKKKQKQKKGLKILIIIICIIASILLLSAGAAARENTYNGKKLPQSLQYVGGDIVNAPFGKLFSDLLAVDRPAINLNALAVQQVDDLFCERLIVDINIHFICHHGVDDLIGKFFEEELNRLCGGKLSYFRQIGINKRYKGDVFQIVKALDDIYDSGYFFIGKIGF